jgi:hypothetical protein
VITIVTALPVIRKALAFRLMSFFMGAWQVGGLLAGVGGTRDSPTARRARIKAWTKTVICAKLDKPTIERLIERREKTL